MGEQLIIINWSLIGSFVLSIWFLSEFKTHIINTILRKDLDESNVEEYIALNWNFKILKTDFTISEMILCPICLGFWIALIISISYGNMLTLPIVYMFQMIGFGILKKLLN
jgi:hypothetical protein|tara:strand:- start:94 stop:426 length:333 start_codon:yes stop_codon:yes gene_type:complete